MVVDQRVKVVGHHLKVEYLEAGRVGGVRLPGVAHGFAEFIENALVADDRAKGALVAGDLKRHEEPAVKIVDVGASQLLPEGPFAQFLVVVKFSHRRHL